MKKLSVIVLIIILVFLGLVFILKKSDKRSSQSSNTMTNYKIGVMAGTILKIEGDQINLISDMPAKRGGFQRTETLVKTTEATQFLKYNLDKKSYERVDRSSIGVGSQVTIFYTELENLIASSILFGDFPGLTVEKLINELKSK